jgi:hypothetical protein
VTWTSPSFALSVTVFRGGIERLTPQEMPAPPKFVVVGKALFHHSLRDVRRNLGELRFIDKS